MKPVHAHHKHKHTHKRWVYDIRILSRLTKRVTIIFIIAAVKRNDGSIAGNTMWLYIKYLWVVYWMC